MIHGGAPITAHSTIARLGPVSLMVALLMMGIGTRAYGHTTQVCPLTTQANDIVAGTGPGLSALRAASARGHRNAQILVSIYYSYRYGDLGQLPSKKRARKILWWLHIAARGSEPISAYLYGAQLWNMGNARKNYALIVQGEHLMHAALRRLKTAAHTHCGALDAFVLATAYARGYARGAGVKKDVRKVFLWGRRAAHGGSSLGQAMTGAYYAAGPLWLTHERTEPASCAKGLKWLQESVASGNPKGEAALGALYDQGLCVGRSPQKAIALFRSAAKKGFGEGYYGLGHSYIRGVGVKRDVRTALHDYVRALRYGTVKNAPAMAARVAGLLYMEIPFCYYTDTHLTTARKDIVALNEASHEGFKGGRQLLAMLYHVAHIGERTSRTPFQKAGAERLRHALAPYFKKR